MATRVFVGCAMWAQRAWVGRYLPAVPSGRELEVYSQFLNAVEGNTTFYATPNASLVERWRQQLPPGFRFVFKAPRTITHERRLRDVGPFLDEFTAAVAPLHDHIGAITLQLPASFAPVDLPVLAGVVRGLSRDVRWAVEVRHAGFFDAPHRSALDAVLSRCGVERVVLDSRALFRTPPATAAGHEAWTNKPRLPVIAEPLTDAPIVRFIGSEHGADTTAGLSEWTDIVGDWLRDGRTPTVFVHTPDNATAPELARGFHRDVCERWPLVERLAEPTPVSAVVQGDLFALPDDPGIPNP